MTEDTQREETSIEKENLTFGKEAGKLGRVLNNMEASKISSIMGGKSSLWWKKVFFLIALLTSIVPTYFVVEDRWLGNLISIKAVDDAWWNIPVLKQLAYPRYFLIIFCIAAFVWLVVLIWRGGPTLALSNLSIGQVDSSGKRPDEKQFRAGDYLSLSALGIASVSAVIAIFTGRIPGWELVLALLAYVSGWMIKEYPLEEIKHYFQENGRFLLDISVFVVALCCALYAIFGESKPNLIFFILFILAGINLLRHRKAIPAIFWISTACLVALTWKINGWEYVVIGDEYNFYNEVRNILENRSAWQLINTTFNGNFVYGTHPYFSSYIHDFFMKLFDNHNFGWRFSNPFLVASSLFFFYYFFRAHVPRRTALITIALLGFSHYLLSFSKIGYNNLQALFAMSLMLAAFTWALRSMTLTSLSVLG